jgi:3-oxoacyl-[acyl-carrier protein] reductase
MGRAIARRLAQEGARVALVARTAETLQRVADEIAGSGGEALVMPTDITSAGDIEHMAREVVGRYGKVDLLVNNAFWGPPASLEDTTEDLWDRTINTSLKGAYLCTRAIFPTMRANGGGRIVMIGSMAGKIGEDNRTAYCAAKWGLEGLTAALQVEMVKHNIRVHLISPAATYTPFWDEALPNLEQSVIDRMIPADTIAEAVMWVLRQPDAVHVPDVPVYNYRNPFEGKGSPFE